MHRLLSEAKMLDYEYSEEKFGAEVSWAGNSTPARAGIPACMAAPPLTAAGPVARHVEDGDCGGGLAVGIGVAAAAEVAAATEVTAAGGWMRAVTLRRPMRVRAAARGMRRGVDCGAVRGEACGVVSVEGTVFPFSYIVRRPNGQTVSTDLRHLNPVANAMASAEMNTDEEKEKGKEKGKAKQEKNRNLGKLDKSASNVHLPPYIRSFRNRLDLWQINYFPTPLISYLF